MKKPNWKEWKDTPMVTVWQACALSLDIDPHSMEATRHGWMAGSGHGPFFEPESFESEAQKEEFELRQRVLLANLSNRAYFSPPDLNMHTPGNAKLRLSEFVSWAVSVVNWENLPPALMKLAGDAPDAKPTLAMAHVPKTDAPLPGTSLEWPADRPVLFGELAHLIAKALWPLDTQEMRYGAARVNLDAELKSAVKRGTLKVRDPVTLGEHTFPVGQSLKDAVVLPNDVRGFLAEREITIALCDGASVATAESPPDAGTTEGKKESPKQRRVRWLAWFEEERERGKRGAVQRVANRELELNPKADRSRIGKQIIEARKEREQAKRDGALFDPTPARKIRAK